MEDRKLKFLQAVLGTDGGQALAKAASRSLVLEQVLVPRAVLAWVSGIQSLSAGISIDYEGEIPGLPETYLSFQKSVSGFSGSVSVDEELFQFSEASVFQLASSVAIAVGCGVPDADEIRDLDLQRIGKSIDLLAKTHLVSKEIEKAKSQKEDEKEDLEKVVPSGHGSVAAPKSHSEPIPPTATAPPTPAKATKTRIPKGAKGAKPVPSYTVKLSQSEARRSCSVCGAPQFIAGNFEGCLCMRELAKSAEVISYGHPWITLELDGKEWDQDAVETLLEIVGR